MKSEFRPQNNRALNIIAFVISTAALLSTIWIVVPAPAYRVWLFSVFAGEWSLGFGIIALIGIVCAILARLKNGGRWWIASISFGTIALVISFYPFLSAYQSAQNSNISLSWREYLSGFGRSDAEFDFTTRTFASVDGQELKVDIYSPPDGIEKNGAGIVVVHGGSWNGGGRSDFPQWNRWLAQNGYTVFDVDYRLAPQPNWRTATGDVKCAVAWVRQNAAEFGISPDRIALSGRSAGGHLALLAAYSENNPQLPSSCSNDSQKKIRAVISFYAPTDLIWGFDNPANQAVIDGRGTLSRFIGGNPHESVEIKNKFLTASPITHVTAQTPPTLLVHGGQDQLVRPQNMNFLAKKLDENGVVNRAIFVSYTQHGFDYNFHGWGAQVVKPQILEFLRENTK